MLLEPVLRDHSLENRFRIKKNLQPETKCSSHESGSDPKNYTEKSLSNRKFSFKQSKNASLLYQIHDTTL